MSRCSGFPECFRLGCSCDEPRDVPTCAHCEVDIVEDELIETAAGLDCCSTRCAVALMTYGHAERCRALACADNAPLTLPPQLCAFCEQPTDGQTAHPLCRDRVRHALEGQDAAIAARAS